MSPLLLALAALLCQEGYQVREDHPRLSVDDPKAIVRRTAWPGDRWKIQFSEDGALGGSVNGAALSTTLRTEGQYR